jgi:adenylate cyclase, class 2
MIEVEVKVRAAPGTLKQVKALGARFLEAEHHQDLYFNAPDRDFRRTDEALRIRIKDGKANLTYKGRKLDASTKSRLELKADIHDPEALKQILVALGFTPSGEVRKTRTKYVLGELTFALDEVEGLGSFLEIEVSAQDGWEYKRDQILKVLQDMGLGEPIRKSYVELLDESRMVI